VAYRNSSSLAASLRAAVSVLAVWGWLGSAPLTAAEVLGSGGMAAAASVVPAAVSLEAAIGAALEGSVSGARTALKDLRLRKLTLGEADENSAARSLAVALAVAGSGERRATLEGSRSAFDPTSSLSFGYTESNGHSRNQFIIRERVVESEGAKTEGSVVGCIFVDGEIANTDFDTCVDRLELAGEEEAASSDSRLRSWFGSVSLAKGFAWGGSLSATFGSTYKIKTSYDVEGLQSILSVQDPFGFSSRAPWTSSLSFSFSSPLPLTKGFGAQGNSAGVGLAVAEATLRRSRWERHLARLTAQQTTRLGYWDLVGAVERLKLTRNLAAAVWDLEGRMRRRYSRGYLTGYEFKQIVAEGKALALQEESAWSGFVAASHALAASLDWLKQEPAPLLLPIDYQAELRAAAGLPTEDAVARALRRFPELKISSEDSGTARLQERFRRYQTRPDLSFSLSYNLAQTDSAFGYDTWRASAVHIFGPDSDEIFVGLTYTVPLWNGAVKAAHRRALAARKGAEAVERQAVSDVVRQVNAATSQLRQAEFRIKDAASRLELAERALNHAVRMLELERISSFELINRYRAVLAARREDVAARVALRQVEARLVRLMGGIEEDWS
jgi:outer membrane protein TolC